jgi:hypothetical protein
VTAEAGATTHKLKGLGPALQLQRQRQRQGEGEGKRGVPACLVGPKAAAEGTTRAQACES